jgi:hypothetical protein
VETCITKIERQDALLAAIYNKENDEKSHKEKIQRLQRELVKDGPAAPNEGGL